MKKIFSKVIAILFATVMVFTLSVNLFEVSAFAANTPVTWNPNDKNYSTTLSNGNLTANTTGVNYGGVRATKGVSSGKWYWEIKYDAGRSLYIGIADEAYKTSGYVNGQSVRSFYSPDGSIYDGKNVSVYGRYLNINDVIGVLLDMDAGQISFTFNGVSQGVAFSDLKSLDQVYPFIATGSSGTGGTGTANFGATPFIYAVPEGYLPYEADQVTAPLNLSPTAGDERVILNWDVVEGATGYNVKWGTTSGSYTNSQTVTSATYDVTGLTNGTTYYFAVSALSGTTESANSNEVSATPKDDSKKLKLVLEINEEKQLSVSEDLSDNTLMTWTSSDSSIATVDQNGKVKALKPGNTVITSTSKDGTYTEIINVLVVDLEYQLAVDLNIGDTCRLTVDDLTNTAKVTWTAYDSTIASVSSKGKVSAVSEGLTYITAIDEQGKEMGRIYIRVRK